MAPTAATTCTRSWALVRRSSTTTTTATSTSFLRPGRDSGPSRSYRNDLAGSGAGATTLRFTDVTESIRHRLRSYGMGAAVGDYDNDGDLDLFVTTFGANALYRNNGNGTFTDATREAGVSDPRWSTSAAFVDYDRDGDLDLFVANYLDFTIADNKICHDPVGARDYCSPRAYRPVPDRLLPERRATAASWTSPSLPASPGPTATGSAWRSAITTATAGPTSTSPTTRPRTSCGSTGTTARSWTRVCCRARR